MARLKQQYNKTIKPALQKKLKLDNVMAVPALDKIVLNMGVSEAVKDRKSVDNAVEDMALISGQKPVVTYAKKSIAQFKVRDGMPLGCKVTLRGARMYEFIDRLINIAMPRQRDFRGTSPNSFDGNGNYALGIKEHIIFPEIDYDKAEKIRGMDIIICTTTEDDDQARELLREFNMPFTGDIKKKKKAA